MRRALWELRWQVLWYGLGLGLFGSLAVWAYPAFEDVLKESDYPQEYLDFFGGSGPLSQPTTYLTTQYQSFAPIVLVIFAVVASTGMVAGEEGRGALETVLAQPIARSRYMMEKAAAFVLASIAICLVVGVLWLTSMPFVDLHGDVTLGELWAGTASMLPLVWCFGALGFLVGAVAPSRGQAAGILTVVAIAAFLLASFARTVAPIEWMQYASPYYYSDAYTVLGTGIVWWHVLVLAGAAVMAAGLAVLSFAGREIGAGVWQPRSRMPVRTR
jgi:ABC-2 type transport system permease protein